MLGLEDLRDNEDLINEIDWSMTPEEAVTLYLEWGNNWSHGRMVKSKNDVSYYFIVNTWEKPAKIYLIRRNSEEAVEMAAIDIPESLREPFLKSVGGQRGVFSIDDNLRRWLVDQLRAHGTVH